MNHFPVTLLLLISLSSCSKSVTTCGRISRAERVASSVVSSINSYYTETSALPVPDDLSVSGDRMISTRTAEGLRLINTLCGFNLERNPRAVPYLKLFSKDGKHIDKLDDGDGNPYWIVIDSNGDGKLEFKWGKMVRVLPGKLCAVMSAGQDGLTGTKDDVTTW